MSAAIEKCSFYRLLEVAVRAPPFFAKVRAVANNCEITEEIAVDSIFMLIDEIEEIDQKLVKELDAITNKFTKYTEVKYHITQLVGILERSMRFGRDGHLTRESIMSLKPPLRDYVNTRKKSIKKD